MTQEDKELLLKDLCARLPYEVKVQDTCYTSLKPTTPWLVDTYSYEVRLYADENWQSIENIKPYLRPMSSMTDEELEECRATCKNRPVGGSVLDYATIETFDWLNTHQFNYRLPSRLFIEVTEENNPYK